MLCYSILPILSFTSLVAGTTLEDTPAVFAPWEITRLTTFSPSGRPNSSPWSLINVTITDPNTIPAGQTPTGTAVFEPVIANCSTAWTFDSDPFNQVFNCTDIDHGSWTFEMLNDGVESPIATQNFNLWFKQARKLRTPGGNYSIEFEGTGQFRIGENMEGICGGSGVCSFSLKNEAKPFSINQTRTECSGLCG